MPKSSLIFVSEPWESDQSTPPDIDWQNFCNRLSDDDLTQVLECARKARLSDDIKRSEQVRAKLLERLDDTYEVTIHSREDCNTCTEWDPRAQDQCDECRGKGYISLEHIVTLDKEVSHDDYPEESSWEAFDVPDNNYET
jgi:hypothetical protein